MLLCVLACLVPAERMGVELPKAGGVEALSMEDLKRDTWRLVEPALEGRGFGTPGYSEGVRRVVQRFEEMSLHGAFPDGFTHPAGPGTAVCGRHDGDGPVHALFAHDDGSGVAGGALPAALTISLAKVSDSLDGERPGIFVFCITPDLDAVQTLAGGTEAVVLQGLDLPDAVDEVDYRALRALAESIWTELTPRPRP